MIDRISLELPQVQQDLIAAVRESAKKLVLVVVSGSALPFNESAADAAVYAMYGGEEAGNGLAMCCSAPCPHQGGWADPAGRSRSSRAWAR